MAVQIAGTRQTMADSYKNIAGSGAPYVALYTGNPGASGNSNEVTGGTPAYARKQTTWTSGSGGALSGTSVTIDVPAGTYTYAGIWTAASGGSCIDWVAITSTTLGAQGQIVVTPSFTQT
ncbi:hypothetical protein HUN08_12550 [Gordonia sp. X0973]|uniref:phage tail fiber protein n=1 Tax=Gordonia sp. X0973 TaxID=2742602 RepID=UPI000F54B44A|nr:hypothetical protein [Gordonia sp. X0973]QKT07924.1 hypothetical protein HUN08_12550 [Gordonia sp. X0973]